MCSPKQKARKVLISHFLFVFSFKKWKVVFNFSICSHWKTFCKRMYSAKGFCGIKLFLNCGKNPWWMKFNFFNKKCNLWFYYIWSFHWQKQRCYVKKMFLNISHISLENTYCVGVSLIKLRLKACNFIKKTL